jgi:hypothetical protein
LRNYCIQLHVELYAANYARSNYARLLPALYIYIGMTLLVHLTNYGEFRKLIMGTNLRSELNKVYYRGKVYTCEQLSTQKLDFPLYARVYDDELVLLRTLQTYTTAIPVDDYLDLFA